MQQQSMIHSERVGNVLKWFPENSFVYIYKTGEVDVWGLKPVKEEKIKVGCRITGKETSSSIESKSGKQIIPTYTISFNGSDVDVEIGDFIEVEGYKKEVLSKRFIRSLSGDKLGIKITV